MTSLSSSIKKGENVNGFHREIADGLYPIEIVVEKTPEDREIANKLVWTLLVHGAIIPDEFHEALLETDWLNDENRIVVKFLLDVDQDYTPDLYTYPAERIVTLLARYILTHRPSDKIQDAFLKESWLFDQENETIVNFLKEQRTASK